MTKKSLWMALLVCCAMTLTAAAEGLFTCNVMVGSSDGVSLVFGQAAAEDVKPFPPFSAMFGVKDVYLANVNNFETAGVAGDMARVSTDLRPDARKWVIVANSNASLKFEMTNADKLYCSYTDPKKAEQKNVEIANNGTLSVKAGVSYTLSLDEKVAPVTPAQDQTNLNAVATKDKDTGSYITTTKVAGLAAGNTYTFAFVCDGEVGEQTSGDKDWMVELGNATDVTWNDDKVTFKANGDTVDFTAAATTGSSAPLNATLLDSSSAKVAAVNAILQKLGTLDFDDNGIVNGNDATFFYNYVSIGGADYVDEITPYADSTITDDLSRDAEKALNFFKSMNGSLDELSLVESDVIGEEIANLGDSSTFFYNYESIGGADYPDEITPYTSRKDNTEQNLADAQEALDNIREMLE